MRDLSSARTKFLRKLFRSKVAVVGLGLCLFVMLIAVFGEYISGHNSTDVSTNAMFAAPSANYFLGTDNIGRDLFARICSGTGLTLIVSVCSVLIAVVFGTILGLIGGYYGGKLDIIISGFMDSLWAFPAIILAMSITVILGPSMVNISIAIGVITIPNFCRLVRSMVLSIRETEYVMGAKAIGLNNLEIIIKYVLPNVIPPVIVQITLSAAQAVIAEASLSFLGLGVQPPAASLGSLLKTGYPYLARAPWLSIYPGIAIILLVLGLNFLGDGLRDALDVRLRTD